MTNIDVIYPSILVYNTNGKSISFQFWLRVLLIMQQKTVKQLLVNAHNIPLNELLEQISAGENGLNSGDVNQRRAQYGANVLVVKKSKPEMIKFLLQFKNYFAVLLLIGSLLAFLAENIDPAQGNIYIAYALLSVVFLNATFTYLQERHNEHIMESFQDMLPQMVNVLRDNKTVNIKAVDVVVGDILLLDEGDRVCADARLLEHNQLKVDMSSLTGESEPQLRDLQPSDKNLLKSRNMVLSGTLVQSGNGKAVICATGMNTQFGQVIKLTKETEETETPIRKELRHFIRIIGLIAIVLGVSFFLISVAMGKGQIASLIFAIGIIVANVPEGLLPTVTLSLSMASQRMAKKNALIKSLESVETLGSTTVICTDKTGTLTQNKISVNSVVLNNQIFSSQDRNILTQAGYHQLFEIMTLCNNAHMINIGYSGDPTEVALLSYIEDLFGRETDRIDNRISELPFDSVTKRMITINKIDQQSNYRALLKGAPETVLAKCSLYFDSGEFKPLTDSSRLTILNDFKELASRGERVLAFASKNISTPELNNETEFVFIGLVGMIDPARPEVPDAIKRCHDAGIKLIMITGDYGITADAIAREIGLIKGEGCIIIGDELSKMSANELSVLLSKQEIIFARTSPEQKLQIVNALQQRGEVVCVTGDGVNDAPALKNADIGVAMGITGTDVAKEASNMVLMDDNFATIVSAVEEGRTIFENIKKFIAYILTSNVPEILPFIAYVVLDFPLALTIVLILAIDLGTDVIPALGLGTERSESDVMKRPPRPRAERLLSRNMLIMSYGIVGMLQAFAGFFSFFVVLLNGGWQWGEALVNNDILYRTAVTAFFASIIICQIADVIICRTRRQSLFTVGFLSNRLVLLGIASELSLLALISYHPVANEFFATQPLQVWQLLLSVPFAILIILGDEIRRYFVRRENSFVLKWLTW